MSSEIPSPDLTETTLENAVSQRHTNSHSHTPFYTLSLAHENRTSQSCFLFFSSSAFPSCLVRVGSSVDEDQEDGKTKPTGVCTVRGRVLLGLLRLCLKPWGLLEVLTGGTGAAKDFQGRGQTLLCRANSFYEQSSKPDKPDWC